MVPVAQPPTHSVNENGAPGGGVMMSVDDARLTHPVQETVNAVSQYAATATLASYPPSTVDNPPSTPSPKKLKKTPSRTPSSPAIPAALTGPVVDAPLTVSSHLNFSF